MVETRKGMEGRWDYRGDGEAGWEMGGMGWPGRYYNGCKEGGEGITMGREWRAREGAWTNWKGMTGREGLEKKRRDWVATVRGCNGARDVLEWLKWRGGTAVRSGKFKLSGLGERGKG